MPEHDPQDEALPLKSPWIWPAEPAAKALATVLYFAGECLVVNKPSGLLTQAPPGIPSIEAQTRRFWQQLTEKSPMAPEMAGQSSTGPNRQSVSDYVGVPHRLDRATSGALLLGQTKAVTRKLASQFERRTVRKIYWALLEGRLAATAGTWHDWLRKLPDQALSEITTADDPAAQSAELDFKVLACDGEISLLEIELKTGRTHQIRLQTSARNCPILGDAAYGAQRTFGTWEDDERLRAIALHARKIDFWHPKLHHPVVITAPVPRNWREFAVEHASALLPLLQTDDVV
jgi:23S rRNA pseudouridine1911/1915/1917 synthase